MKMNRRMNLKRSVEVKEIMRVMQRRSMILQVGSFEDYYANLLMLSVEEEVLRVLMFCGCCHAILFFLF